MKQFFVTDLSSLGDIKTTTEYGYAELEQIPGASDLIVQFATHIYASPEAFEIPIASSKTLTFRWRSSAKTAGIATLRNRGELTSLGLLCSGIDPEADRLTLEAFHKHILRELHNTGHEPSFALTEIRHRPLVAVVPFQEPDQPAEQLIAALADRCFAAAFFRYLNLA